MSESYTIGGDTLIKVFKTAESGQSFLCREDHILNFIDLELRGQLIIPEPVIQVFNADMYGHPYGDCVSRNRHTVEQHCSFLTTGRARFSMTPVLLSAPGWYVIIVQNYPPFPGSDLWWQYDKDDATYPRGHRISTTDGGATWIDHLNDDHMFAEFGNPPLPKPDPPPPISNFAPLKISYYHCLDAVTIALSTSVPCHLTCYWTDKKPLKHHTSRIVRGLTVPWATYFCFVAWQAVEQTEPGDTLYHTFEFDEWPACLKMRPTIPFYDLQNIAPLWEPWGITLTENYPWVILADPNPPGIDLTNGILTLTFTSTPHSGIIYNLPTKQIPLQSPSLQPLRLTIHNTEVLSINPLDNIAHMILLRKDGQYIALYFMIKGSIAGFGSGSYGFQAAPPQNRAWWYIGPGQYDINLIQRFQQAATDIGIDPDPTDWYVNLVEIAHADPTPVWPSYLKNDYVALYHPSLFQAGGRWFTFRGTVDDIQSPSVGPIFQHCYSLSHEFTNGGFETWADPSLPPAHWTKEVWGIGTANWVREETNVHTGLYAAKLEATGAGCQTLLQQLICPESWRGKNIKFTAWSKGGGGGQRRIILWIPGAWGQSWLMSPTGIWKKTTVTFFVTPAATLGYLLIISLAQTAGTTSVLFDSISFEEV